MESSDISFIVAFLSNLFITIAFTLLFVFLRKREKKIYEPRTLKKENAPSLTDSYFGWIRETIKYDEDKVMEYCGGDSLTYLRFIKTCLIIMLLQAIYAIVVLSPVNLSGSNKNLPVDNPKRTTGLEILSMSNIADGSRLLWFHTISVFVNTMIAIQFLYRESKRFIRFRNSTKKQTKKIENFTTMVSEIPKSENFDNEGLKDWFQKRYPYWNVMKVQRALDTSKIESKLEEREKYIRKFEREKFLGLQKGKKRTTKNGFMELVGDEVDRIQYYKGKIITIEKDISNLKQDDRKQTGVAFVTFDSIYGQVVCSESLINSNINAWMTDEAPEPKAVNWKALKYGHRSKIIRSLLVYVATFFLIFFWMIPISFLQGLANLNKLSEIKYLKWIADIVFFFGPKFTAFIEGFLPGLILSLFMSVILPIIVRILTNIQAFYSLVSFENSFYEKMFFFFVFNTFLGSTIAGSIMNILSEVLKDPSLIISLLAGSLPKQSFFFTNYIMLLATSGFSVSLLRPTDLIISKIKYYLAKSKRDRVEAYSMGDFGYSLMYASNLLVFLIVTTFSTMYPIIMVFGILYFAFSYLIDKYNILFVYEEEFEGNGGIFPKIFSGMCISLIIYQLTMIGVLSTYQFYYSGLVTALIVFTLYFWWKMKIEFNRTRHGTFESLYLVPSQNEENQEILSSDKDDIEMQDSRDVHLQYLQPSLKPFKEIFLLGEYDEDACLVQSSED